MADLLVAAGKTIRVSLSFQGIARYSLWEFTPTAAGGWSNQALERDGSSEDYRLDSFDLDPLPAGSRVEVVLSANMTTSGTSGTVSCSASVAQDGDDKGKVGPVQADLSSGGYRELELRLGLVAR